MAIDARGVVIVSVAQQTSNILRAHGHLLCAAASFRMLLGHELRERSPR